MVIVAGHVTVDPEQRESYLAGCMSVVEKARRGDGCLSVSVSRVRHRRRAALPGALDEAHWSVPGAHPSFSRTRFGSALTTRSYESSIRSRTSWSGRLASSVIVFQWRLLK